MEFGRVFSSVSHFLFPPIFGASRKILVASGLTRTIQEKSVQKTMNCGIMRSEAIVVATNNDKTRKRKPPY